MLPPLIPPPPTYTGRPRNVPLPKRVHGWDMMTPPRTSSTNAHLLCDCGTTRHTIHIHGRIVCRCKYAQYAMTLLKTCQRGLALCTLVKHQHTLLSDISAVGSLDSLRGVVVVAYGVHTDGFPSLCDGVNLNDRGKAACECVCVCIEFDYCILTRLCVIIVVCISFAYTYVSPRFFLFRPL